MSGSVLPAGDVCEASVPPPLARADGSSETMIDIDIDIDIGAGADASLEAMPWSPPRAFIADWTVRALAAELAVSGEDFPTSVIVGAETLDTDADADLLDAEALGAGVPGAIAPIRHELSVRLLTAEAMRALNREWRDRDRPTNVLSFPAGLPALPLDGGGSVRVLGDLAFCPALIAREADEQGKPLGAHWAHLVVHGVLHLRGLDHEGEREAADMEALERALLSRQGIPDPYLDPCLDSSPVRVFGGALPRHDHD